MSTTTTQPHHPDPELTTALAAATAAGTPVAHPALRRRGALVLALAAGVALTAAVGVVIADGSDSASRDRVSTASDADVFGPSSGVASSGVDAATFDPSVLGARTSTAGEEQLMDPSIGAAPVDAATFDPSVLAPSSPVTVEAAEVLPPVSEAAPMGTWVGDMTAG